MSSTRRRCPPSLRGERGALRERIKRKRPQRGVCRFCGCTAWCACPGGCYWVDAAHTVCSECVGELPALKLAAVLIAALAGW